ncbi:MAG: hypothetical protein VR72_07670 [Clostridiaceae bacterium BRH_c20a]|nr:MAG: hypothetical protein VR72_07670 [Clostridiaceae bacterium BRH_c20a]
MVVSKLYQGWLNAVDKHDYKKARKLYMALLKEAPLTAGINFPMGVWYKEKELFEEAEMAFKRALITDPGIVADSYYYLGNVSREQGDHGQAIAYYRESLKVDPNFFEAQYNLGKIYAILGQSKEALQEFTKALELSPEDVDTYINIGVELSNQGKRKEALESYEKALELNPESYLVYSNIGVEFTALGNYEQGILYHKKALALNSFYADGWYNLACSYARADDFENSLKALERSIRLDASNIEYAKKDPELDNIKSTSGYKSIIKKFPRP